ncbi:phage tail tip lysozyme [Thalassovita sp.]|uniref:phage tail tip lysozyme n=1 Tax=Thalassovita sp. TaxID=1979401 RepID=UPI002B272C9E|nr:phage tail tip lysozyme [Thalassovita sp.]
MSAKQFLFELLFRGDSSQAKQAAQEVKTAVAGVAAQTEAGVPKTERETAALHKNTDARKKLIRAAEDQARAGQKAAAPQPASSPAVPAGSPSPLSPPPSSVPGPSNPAPAATPQEIEAMRAAYVPMFAAQRAYQDEVERITKAESLSALSTEEATDARMRAQQSFDRMSERINRTDAVMRGNTRTMRLQSHEARVLGYQVTDTFQSFALGMSPMQVLLQQGPQVIDVFGGIGNTLRYMRQSLTGFRVLMGGTTAAVVGGAMAWNQYLGSMKAIEVATTGTGRGIGLTAGQLDLMSKRAADVGNISVSRARGLSAELVGSGKIGGDNVEGLVEIARDFAATNQIELDEVGPALIETFASPGKTAEGYYSKGNLEAVDLEKIQRLEAQNGKYEAQALLLDRIRGKLVPANDTKTMLGRTWDGFGKGASNFGSFVGETISGVTGTRDAPLDEEITRIEQALERLGKRRKSPQTEARLQGQLAALYAERDGVTDTRRGLEEKQSGIQALEYAKQSPANALAKQESALRNQIASLKAGLAAPDLSEKQRADITRAIEGQSAALEALSNRQQRANEMALLDLRISTERNPLRRAELTAEKARLEAAGKALGLADRQLEADRARKAALNEVIAASSNQAAGMAEEAEVRTRLNMLQAIGLVSAAGAASWMERELALRPLLIAAAEAEGEEKAQLVAEVRKLEKAYDDLTAAQKRDFSQQSVQSSDKRTAQLRLETTLIGRSNDERIRAMAAAKAEQDIKREDLSGGDADAVRKAAREEAEAEIQKQRRQRQTDLATQQMLDAYDAAAAVSRNPVSRAGIEAQREYARAIAEGADAEEAAARAAQVRARALNDVRIGITELLRSQDEQLARLRLEATLIGQSERTRRRVLALYEAELDIQKRGLASSNDLAEQIRNKAIRTADWTSELERTAEAWDRVRDAAEGAIDGPTDSLLDGDFDGALEAIKDEVGGLFADLAIKNPLKNALLGTDYATLGDVGGLGGIWQRLAGGGKTIEGTALNAQAMQAAAMTVTTPMVTLNAQGLAGNVLGTVSSQGTSGAGGLPGSAGVQSQVWNFFKGKGLKPHQIGAIMGNVSGESGFDPLAKGDFRNGQATSFGLFQHHGPRATELLKSVGGMNGLGNVNGQLEHVWKELMTSENGAFQKLMNSTNVQDATSAWMRGFERPSEDAMSKSWPKRLSAAEAAMLKFTNTTGTAAQGLGTLGSGFDTFGQALSQGLSGGGGSSILSSLLGFGFKALGVPGFAKGGRHSGGLRVVGENGPELEYTGPSTIVPADMTRQILTASSAPTMSAVPANVTFAPVISPINNSSTPLDMEVRETTDARGQKKMELVFSDIVATGMGAKGGKAPRVMRQQFGLRQNGINRG